MAVTRQEMVDLFTNQQNMKRIYDIPMLDKIDKSAADNLKKQKVDKNKMHPIRPHRGELYMADITTNAGSELSSRHPVIIISNDKGNKYTSKVIVVAIEGDGLRINPAYQMQISTSDLSQGRLNKNPSRIILSEILTLDKSRLSQKIGTVKPDVMEDITYGIAKQLSIPTHKL